MAEFGDKDIVGNGGQSILLTEFLESMPPYRLTDVSDLGVISNQGRPKFTGPDIQLHCNHDGCNGVRYFRWEHNGYYFLRTDFDSSFLIYKCCNCRHTAKTYAVRLRVTSTGTHGQIIKLGELPEFGPPIPPKLITLIRPNRKLFYKGRRAEIQGMGIGAFAYYRRVVENEKNRILDEIIKVCEKLTAPPEVIESLRRAEKETRFTEAVKAIKDGLPQALLIDGHNPLTLLHSALSEGLHAQSDEECLELATSIRVVLTDLAERVAQALKDEAELKTAVSRLFRKD